MDRAFYVFTAVLSAVALSVIGWLLLVRRAGPGATDLSFMPAVNAALNATSAILLTVGWVSIRRGARRAHKFLMVAAFAVSGLFLAGYLTYHYVHGDTKFLGTGAIRGLYFTILVSHIVLSMGILPGALLSFWFASTARLDRHVRVTRILLPAWLYVSVTGVAIWFLLRAHS